MANRHCGIGIEQQHRRRLADDIASTHDHSFASRNRNIAALQDFHDPCRRARHQPRTLRRKESDIHRMEAVHIFSGIDRQQHFLRVHLCGKGQLHQDAVYVIAPIQAPN